MPSSTTSSASNRSSVSYKRKESQIKLKLAKLAKESERKKLLDEESAAEIRRKADEAAAEADRIAKAVERDLRMKERDREIELAAEELRAWDEMSVGSLASLSMKKDEAMTKMEPLSSQKLRNDVTCGFDEQIAAPGFDRQMPAELKISAMSSRKPDYPQSTSFSSPRKGQFHLNNVNSKWEESVERLCGSGNERITEAAVERGMPLAATLGETRNGECLPPRPELMQFDGNPLNYYAFVKTFRTHVTSKVVSEEARFTYLLQLCSPAVRQRIDHFSLQSNAFELAWHYLFKAYGRPELIATRCEDTLLSLEHVKMHDLQALNNMAMALQKAESQLQDVEHCTALNSIATLKQLMSKLPESIQSNWIEYSYKISWRNGRRATFSDFVEFVSYQADLANSDFGSLQWSACSRAELTKNSNRKRASVFVAGSKPQLLTAASEKDCCPLCEGLHMLCTCEQFRKLTRYKRGGFLKQRGLCFKCFGRGHMAKDCKIEVKCSVDNCSDKDSHHTLMHKFKVHDGLVERNEEAGTYSCAAVSSLQKSPRWSRPCLLTVPVTVRSDTKEIQTYALLDTGSELTFCDRRIVNELQLSGPEKMITVQPFSTTSRAEEVFGMSVSMSVSPVNVIGDLNFENVTAVDNLPFTPHLVPNEDELEFWGDYWNLRFPSTRNKSIGLLVGVDNVRAIMPLEYRYGPEGGPDAIRTPLGWTICGPLKHESDKATSMYVHLHETETAPGIGILSPIDSVRETELKTNQSSEDRIAYSRMKREIEHVDGHFQLPLLWREREPHLPDNRYIAEKRLLSLKRRLAKDEKLHKRYTEEIEKYVEEGYAEAVPDDFDNANEAVVNWYLPHHPVFNAKKPDKVRIVFDCAAEYHGKSLNKALLQGPDLTNSLVGVLTRFREEKIAVVADIKGMFHQVKVTPKDRDALRFLWWPGGNMNDKAKTYRMTVHLFGAISSPSSAAFCLKQTALQYGDGYSERACKVVDNNFYVDDLLLSCPTVEDAQQVVAEVKEMLRKAGFQLTKWLSNHNDVVSSFPNEEKGLANKPLPDANNAGERVLGVLWDIENDEFRFSIDVHKRPPTKRGILSMMHSLYDPLGFVAPILIEPKSLLRNLKDRDWDELISDSECERWEKWLQSLEFLKKLRVKRSFQSDQNVIRYELHHFADASATALGAVSYLRTVDVNMNINCYFLLGKSYLAPFGLTIPRLELSAALTAARLDELLRKELSIEIDESYFWSDSKAVLMSIRNPRKKFPVYVANRLAEIETLSLAKSWHYVPSQLNPADEVSRGMSAKRLVEKGKWLTGPEFLCKEQDKWPTEEVAVALPATLLKEPNSSPIDKLINRHSSLHRLKVATSWILRFIKFLKLKADKVSVDEIKQQFDTYVTKDELDVAEKQLIKFEQRTCLPQLFRALKDNKELSKAQCSRALMNNNPHLVDGVIRLNGRIGKAPVPFETRFPCVLPPESSLTKLFILECHARVGHNGLYHTFNELRTKFWFERGSSFVRRCLKDCIICRKRNAKLGEQFMSDLPLARLHFGQPPFTHTGVDYFGPVLVTRGRSEEKRYGCIFTCMSTRGVHIEVAHSLSTESFLMALERFVARRRHVEHLYSDNGTNFVGAHKILKEYISDWNQKHIHGVLRRLNISWHFNTPTASHFGGAWERLIRTVRKIMTDISPHRIYNDENLRTVLTKVESIINSRPLTPIQFSEVSEKALTPNDILAPGSDNRMIMIETSDRDRCSRNAWRRAQHVVNCFWQRWQKEYLPTLLGRKKWRKCHRNFQVCDIVLVASDNA